MTQQTILKQLLEAGVHFGHQTQRWNPKMKRFIFGQRNGIYIIDLKKTAEAIEEGAAFLRKIASEGGRILFVGTKKQAQNVIKEEAERCHAYYVNERWLGGMLTNFSTIKRSVNRLKEINQMQETGTFEALSKKERAILSKEIAKLKRNLSGMVELPVLPQALWIVDAKKEEIAVQEARRLGIPVVALLDTNTDPDMVDYPVPGNDDAIRSIKYITSLMANAIAEGYHAYMAAHPDKTLEEVQAQVQADMERMLEEAVEAETEQAEKRVMRSKDEKNLDAKRKRKTIRTEERK